MELPADYFDLTSRHLRIDRPFGTMPDDSGDRDHELVASAFRFRQHLRIKVVGIDQNLSQAIAVPQIYEQKTAQMAVTIDPAVKTDFLSNVTGPKLTTGMGSLEFAEQRHVFSLNFLLIIDLSAKFTTELRPGT
jgi:hypothetical protein